MSKKTEVVRLTSQEAELISLLREHGVRKVLDEIDLALSLDKEGVLPTLSAVKYTLDPKPYFTMEQLVEQGFISPEDSNYLIQAISSNKSIAITGDTGTGKTVLLHALLCAHSNIRKVCLVDSKFELDLKRSIPDKLVPTIDLSGATASDIMNALFRPDYETMMFNSVETESELFSMTSAIKYGLGVCCTVSSLEAVKEKLVSRCRDSLSNRIGNLFDSHNFIEVSCKISEEGTRTASVVYSAVTAVG